MAIIKLGETLIGMRGTLGGITFSANGSGTYCKKLAVPKRKRSLLQNEKRARFSTIRRDWMGCTNEQIADWEAFALDPPEEDYNSLGDRVYLTGSAWHTRINMRRLQAGDAIERDCPTNTPVDPPSTLYGAIYDSGNEVDDSYFGYGEDDFIDSYAVLHVAIVSSGVRQVCTTGYMSIWCGAVVGASTTVINDELRAAYGVYREGQAVFAELRRQSYDGIRSTALAGRLVVLLES